jgi:ribonuclease T2
MRTFWPDYQGDDETFWEHEWGKHGTCVNTFDPECYENYKPQEEVGDYFAKAMELYEGLSTYKVSGLPVFFFSPL